MAANILDPVVLFFILGLTAGILKTSIKIPEGIYDTLSIFLLLSIGLKGGKELADADLQTMVLPVVGTLFLSVLIPLLAYSILRKMGRFSIPDSAALAAHYGSVSAVTFAIVLNYLTLKGVSYEKFMTVLLVLLEVPGIAVGLYLAKGNKSLHGGTLDLLREVVLSKSIYLLCGGFIVGFLAGPARMEPIAPFFFGLFKGALTLFLFEMGLVVSRRLADLKQAGAFLVCFGVMMPLLSGTIGVFVGEMCGLSLGGTTVLATMVASASYIAAPAAVRMAIPEANPTYYLTAALGITFPFNIIVGVPIYYALAKFAFSS